MTRSHFLKVFQNKVICKRTVSIGWCKESSERTTYEAIFIEFY